ncbi:HU family DNA-binding protein [Paludibacter sp. 221]|uniref:HU family DNA-binding protein n=1 Tax=Paludibacter sp. 221 TaxID=2302939 RepID=UPI0013D5CFE8|nr:HU family DNA-binding protein [Paludibacter sp. 221]NDV47665.1 HU family DNA-binding protein [Paludibacter sp. 221]
MNKDKISAQEVIDALAAKADITKVLADEFFKAFISSIEDALLANDVVKVKDLGTFKLNWIAPRKSVNVQTGEDIVIDGYYKVIFSPDKELKELVNKPFAHLETVVLDDSEGDKEQDSRPVADEPVPLASLTEQAVEIKDLLSEIKSMPSDGEEEKQQTIVEKKVNKDNMSTDKKVESKKANVGNSDNEPKRKGRVWVWFLLFLVLLFGGVYVLYSYNKPVRRWIDVKVLGRNPHSYNINSPRVDIDQFLSTKTTPAASTAPTVQAGNMSQFEEAFNKRFDNLEIAAVEELGEKSSIARLADKYYGAPQFWVYIYEINKDKIPDPDVVAVGTEIKIPMMDHILVDLNSEYAFQRADELATLYKK